MTHAIIEAKRCCELIPQSPEIFYHTGTLLVRAGKTTEAMDYFSRALALRSDDAEALNEMGEIFANRQKTARPLAGLNAQSGPIRTMWKPTLILDFSSKIRDKWTPPWPVIKRPRVLNRKVWRNISTRPTLRQIRINGMRLLPACARLSKPNRIFGRHITNWEFNWRPKAKSKRRKRNSRRQFIIARILFRRIQTWEPTWPRKESSIRRWTSSTPFYNLTRRILQHNNKFPLLK